MNYTPDSRCGWRLALTAIVAALGVAAPAQAASLVYVQAGNIVLADEDGGNPYQVTADGSNADPNQTAYRAPTEADDGTIMAAKGGELVHLKQNGAVLSHFVPDTGGYPLGAAVAPDGTRVAYNFSSITQCTYYEYSCGYYAQPGAAVSSTSGRNGSTGDVGGTREQDAQWIGNAALVLGTATSYVDYDAVGQSAQHWFVPADTFNPFTSDFPYPEQPVVSRDGTRLALVMRPNSSGGNPSSNDVLEIWHVNPGAPSVAPTPLCEYHASDGGGFRRPAFTPDGSTVFWTDAAGIDAVNVDVAQCTGKAEFTLNAGPAAIPGASDLSFGVAANNPGPRPTPAVTPGPPSVSTPAVTPGPPSVSTPNPTPPAHAVLLAPAVPTFVIGLSGGRSSLTRAVLAKRGITVKLSCPPRCRYDLSLSAANATSRKLGLVKGHTARALLADKKGTATSRTSVTLKLTAKARRALKRLKHGTSVSFVITAHAHTADGRTASRSFSLNVKG